MRMHGGCFPLWRGASPCTAAEAGSEKKGLPLVLSFKSKYSLSVSRDGKSDLQHCWSCALQVEKQA